MLSVIIPTLDSERPLVRTLAALVPGATAGLITEVITADGGSGDETASVADIAGCAFMAVNGSLGQRLTAAASAARAPWLLFLRPGIVLDATWIGEANSFVQPAAGDRRAAVFRLGTPAQPPLRQVWLILSAAAGARPRPEQGLLIAKQFYREIGGHSDRAADPETELLARIGRTRLVTLAATASG